MDNNRYSKGYMKIITYTFFSIITIVVIGSVYIYYNPYPCPSEIHSNLFYPKEYKGTISGFSIDCTKRSFTIYLLNSSDSNRNKEKIKLYLGENYFCMMDKISIGDTIEKDRNSFIIKIINNKKNYTSDYDCKNNCSCIPQSDNLLPKDWKDYVSWDRKLHTSKTDRFDE